MTRLIQLFGIVLILSIGLSSCTKDKIIPDSQSNICYFSLNGSESIEKTIILSNGNLAAIGTLNKQGFIAVFDPDGNTVWFAQQGGIETEKLFDIIETSEGNLLAVGQSNSASEGVINVNFTDGWLVNYSTDGNLNWKRVIGSDKYYERLLNVIETHEGDFIITGVQRVSGSFTYIARLSKDGQNVMWKDLLELGHGTALASRWFWMQNGNIVLAGLCSFRDFGNDRGRWVTYLAYFNVKLGAIISYDTYTDFVREDTYSSTLENGGTLILHNNIDGYSWTTFFEGNTLTAKVQFAKVDFNGNLILERKYSGIGNMDLRNTIKLNEDEFLLCGESSETALGAYGLNNSQAYLTKIDNTGEVIWSSNFGSTSSTQTALNANKTENGWTVYGAMRDAETGTLSYARYFTDNQGTVLK